MKIDVIKLICYSENNAFLAFSTACRNVSVQMCGTAARLSCTPQLHASAARLSCTTMQLHVCLSCTTREERGMQGRGRNKGAEGDWGGGGAEGRGGDGRGGERRGGEGRERRGEGLFMHLCITMHSFANTYKLIKPVNA